MRKSQLLIWSVVNSIGVFLYASAVAWLKSEALRLPFFTVG